MSNCRESVDEIRGMSQRVARGQADRVGRRLIHLQPALRVSRPVPWNLYDATALTVSFREQFSLCLLQAALARLGYS